ncbi:MAG: peptidase domain-containing ABC transporter [Tateyamaria sp.]
MSWFGRTLWKYTPLYVELVFLAICLRFIGLVEPFIFQVIIDRVLPFEREASLLVVVAVFAAVSVFQLAFEILSELLGMRTANTVTRELGARIFEHLFKLPFTHFRAWSVGETITRISETDTIRDFLVGTTIGVFLDLTFVFIYIIVLYTLSPQLTLIILAALPIQIMIYVAMGPFLRRRLRHQFDTDAAHKAQMVENITGIASVKSLSAEDKMLHRLDETLFAKLAANYRVGLINIWNDKLLFIVDRTITISIIYFGAQLVFEGELTLGQLIAFHLLGERVRGPIENFSSFWESWQGIRVSRQRLGDVVNSPIEPFDALPRLPADIGGRLEFQDVDFSYDGTTRVLHDFSFSMPTNALTLVVGPSGVGKSTFGRLASGIERPDTGTVLLDGRDIAQFDPHDVRTRIVYVPQEPYLFTGTIRDNLALSDPDTPDAELTRALRISAADTLVARLPKGLDTPVGERGSALSGGQRQRIAVARALVGRPRVLILDEPTSALDAGAQARMVEELQALKSDTTLIIITHSPDMFTDADVVLDFEKMAH